MFAKHRFAQQIFVKQWRSLCLSACIYYGICNGLIGHQVAAAEVVAIDLAEIYAAQTLEIKDQHLREQWESLFATDPGWIPERILWIRESDQAQRLLAARLLYRGKPWKVLRRRYPADEKSEVSVNDGFVQDHILREWRWNPSLAYIPVYEKYIASDMEPRYILQALINLEELAPERAFSLGLRLLDEDAQDALPQAKLASMRRQALAFVVQHAQTQIVEQAPHPHTAICAALERALTQGSDRDRFAACQVLHGQAWCLPFHQLALDVLLSRYKEQRLSEVDRLALVTLLAQSDALSLKARVESFIGIVEKAEPALAILSASILGRTGMLVPEQRRRLIALASLRVDRTSSLPLREALLGLLARLDPKTAQEKAGVDSPWVDLSAHRKDLRR